MCKVVTNRHKLDAPVWTEEQTAAFEAADIGAIHESLPGYRPTPLVDLPALAEELGLGRIRVKDESHRLGLKAFKALGATYAIYRWLVTGGEVASEPEDFYSRIRLPANRYVFCTATDGNHGRGVAWTAKLLNQRAVIYMPTGTVQARIDNILDEGAEVVVVDGDYDQAVKIAAEAAGKHGWQIISDTSWPGYETIPRWIQSGYLTLFREIDEALTEAGSPTHLFVPGGVGALAAAAAWHTRQSNLWRDTKVISVAPTASDCLLRSAETADGSPVVSPGRQDSIMAGLNCATPSSVAWPFIRDSFDAFVSVSDDLCRTAMRMYYLPLSRDRLIVSGESGAATLAALLGILRDPTLASQIGLGHDSKVVVLNTEGDTDPEAFRIVISGS